MKRLNEKVLASSIERIARYDLEENNVFGSAYIVKQNGKTACEKYFGTLHPANQIPVDENTMFRIASMTKPVTAMAILILIDRGLLSLSTPAKKFFPQFENIRITSENGEDMAAAKTDITILHLLTHTSGLNTAKPKNPRGEHLSLSAEDKRTMQSTIDRYIRDGLDFEPFTKAEYSAFGAFDVLSAIVEQITGEDYGDFLSREIFKPCGMKDTTFSPTEEQWKRMIAMHAKENGKNAIGITYDKCVFEDFPCSHKIGGAGLASTLRDYSAFAEMLRSKGNGIVSQKTFELLSTPHVPENIMPGEQSWGLSVRVVTKDTYEALPIGSYGWCGAFGSHFWVDPENQITAVFMKNSRHDGGAGMSAARFEKAVHESLHE